MTNETECPTNPTYELSQFTGDLERYGLQSEIDKVVAQNQKIIEDELLADSDIGHQFLKLRREKEELLDTIWLATSNRQIRDLWSRVGEILSEESTPLQHQILNESE